jgi:hypothetical protein
LRTSKQQLDIPSDAVWSRRTLEAYVEATTDVENETCAPPEVIKAPAAFGSLGAVKILYTSGWGNRLLQPAVQKRSAPGTNPLISK